MFEEFECDGSGLEQAGALDLLAELEQNTPDEIRRQRRHFRISIKVKVTLRPGNASEMYNFKIQGMSGDLSEGGCRLLLPAPVTVGDIYRLEFDRSKIDVSLTFVRCVRCLLLREDAFEAGFRFFAPISLPSNVQDYEDQEQSLA